MVKISFPALVLIVLAVLLAVFFLTYESNQNIQGDVILNLENNISSANNSLLNFPNDSSSQNSSQSNITNSTVIINQGGGGGDNSGDDDSGGGSEQPLVQNPPQNDTQNNSQSSEYFLHENISVTFFWVGEEANEDNDYIANDESAWDELWKEHYGGIDNPDDREDYFPADFTPKENPFYFALPYNDFNDDGDRKSSAENISWYNEKSWDDLESVCKNRWIRIIKGNLSVYAQWEDVGPFEEDDFDYVFGNNTPKNKKNNNAGLDVSPAIRDFLNLQDIDKVSWQFVNYSDVPEGPWKTIITSSQIYWEE